MGDFLYNIIMENLNALKRESDKWVKIGISSLIPIFVLPIILFLGIFLTAAFSKSVGLMTTIPFVVGLFSSMPLIFIAWFIFMAIALITMMKKHSAYRAAYKNFFSHKVLSGILSEYHYAHNEGISKETLDNLGMVRFGNIYRSEDYVSGRYRDVGFVQSDLTIQSEHRDSDGDKHIVTYFNGKWLVFEFPRRFVTKLAVVGKGCRQTIYARKMEKFETESTEFNKRFKVYMQDGVEMFYLLDPKMIEILQTLDEKYDGKILFLFVDKKLHIGINNGADSFEPPKHKKGDLNEKEEIERLASEFKTVFELVDKLELHKNIFK